MNKKALFTLLGFCGTSYRLHRPVPIPSITLTVLQSNPGLRSDNQDEHTQYEWLEAGFDSVETAIKSTGAHSVHDQVKGVKKAFIIKYPD